MNDRELFLKAADVMRRRGLCKGYYWGPGPDMGDKTQWLDDKTRWPVCIAGALSVAMTGEPTPPASDDEGDRSGYDAVAAHLASLIGVEGDPLLEPVGRLAAWNDLPERTAAEVIAALESAAEQVTS